MAMMVTSSHLNSYFWIVIMIDVFILGIDLEFLKQIK
jgi:hypothetical protein